VKKILAAVKIPEIGIGFDFGFQLLFAFINAFAGFQTQLYSYVFFRHAGLPTFPKQAVGFAKCG
jgi:hypothetical protein